MTVQHTSGAVIGSTDPIPKGVVCLLSALQFYELTTQLPFEVWLAIGRQHHLPKGDLPPVRIFRFSKAAYEFGIERHKFGSLTVTVYSPAKTVADCFKYRNKIGTDVAIEALSDVWSKEKATIDELYEAAKVCRVANVMRPYLECLQFPTLRRRDICHRLFLSETPCGKMNDPRSLLRQC